MVLNQLDAHHPCCAVLTTTSLDEHCDDIPPPDEMIRFACRPISDFGKDFNDVDEVDDLDSVSKTGSGADVTWKPEVFPNPDVLPLFMLTTPLSRPLGTSPSR